jgi:thiamine-phosphate pyrophosphorylase
VPKLDRRTDKALLASRRETLRRARLYFVCEARPARVALADLLEAALAGGVDLIQMRDKQLGDRELLEAAGIFRELADRHRALFILNDRPDLVRECRADGVHVGQDDMTVTEARRLAGPASLIGRSTHTAAQFDEAVTAAGSRRPDQISVGPVWETPTKAGRPAVGLDLIRHAADSGTDAAWFAIGGIDASNVAEVVAAGARRIVVVRAIRDAGDPAAAARELCRALSDNSKRPDRRG